MRDHLFNWEILGSKKGVREVLILQLLIIILTQCTLEKKNPLKTFKNVQERHFVSSRWLEARRENKKKHTTHSTIIKIPKTKEKYSKIHWLGVSCSFSREIETLCVQVNLHTTLKHVRAHKLHDFVSQSGTIFFCRQSNYRINTY